MSRLILAIPASGKRHHYSALLAARTYLQHNPDIVVGLYVPRPQKIDDILRELIPENGIEIRHFEHEDSDCRDKNITMMLTTAFYHAILDAGDNPVMIVDADTYCLKPIVIEQYLERLESGVTFIGRDVRSVWECHEDASRRSYIPPEKRRTYLNAGVILSHRSSLDMFLEIKELGHDDDVYPAMHDQGAVNLVFCNNPDRVRLLDREFNRIRAKARIPDTVIGHMAGEMGGGVGVDSLHERRCLVALRGVVSRPQLDDSYRVRREGDQSG